MPSREVSLLGLVRLDEYAASRPKRGHSHSSASLWLEKASRRSLLAINLRPFDTQMQSVDRCSLQAKENSPIPAFWLLLVGNPTIVRWPDRTRHAENTG